MKLKKWLVTVISGSLSLSAYAADSFGINISGVISPAACTVDITGGSTIDYGSIPVHNLRSDKETTLEKKSTGLTIMCDAPTRVAFRTMDNRSGTTFTPSTWLTVLDTSFPPEMDNGLLGLGVDGSSNPIGGWMVALNNISTDTADTVHPIQSHNFGGRWGSVGLVFLSSSDSLISFALPDEWTPASFRTLHGTLDIQAVLAPVLTLNLSQPIRLDGSVTVEMIYL
ncbi:TPA: DUF1120 domain-containing protein [Klebsiella michiganensis]